MHVSYKKLLHSTEKSFMNRENMPETTQKLIVQLCQQTWIVKKMTNGKFPDLNYVRKLGK